MSESLWDWSVGVYAAPGVAEACLHLQDAGGQNVPLLLWAAWTAKTGRPLDAETIEAACDTAHAWTDVAVAPLRAIRTLLKKPVPDLDDAARLQVRDQVKAVELLAERHLLSALEGLAPPPSGAPGPAIDAMARVARVWGAVVPRAGLIRLSERLPA